MECGAYVFVVEHARLVRPPAAALARALAFMRVAPAAVS